MQRSYSSPLRAEHARQTRLAIIEAARTLFLEGGYSETTIRDIAREAGVAERTVYSAFGDKTSIVTAIADHLRFGGSQVGEGEAEFLESVMAVPDSLGRLRMLVHQGALQREQGLALIARMIRSAARSDPRVRQFQDAMVGYRHRRTRDLAEAVLGQPLPQGERFEQLVDELEAVTGEEVYLLLCVDRGWPRQRYEKYVVDMCLVALERYGLELG